MAAALKSKLLELLGRHIVEHPVHEVPCGHRGIECRILQCVDNIQYLDWIILLASRNLLVAVNLPLELHQQLAAVAIRVCLRPGKAILRPQPIPPSAARNGTHLSEGGQTPRRSDRAA